jgi:RNA polymerase sigma-70 factor (ECF subfamily)
MDASRSTDAQIEELFSSYGGRIHAYVLGLVRDPVEADDLTQETFLRALRRLETLRDPARVSSWLYRIATNLVNDRYRARRRRPQDLPLSDAASEPAPANDDARAPRLDVLLARREMSDCVPRTIDELSDPYRAAILLHDLEGLTNPEIAELLGCTLETVKIRLHRARSKLRSALEAGCSFSRDEEDVLVCEPRDD